MANEIIHRLYLGDRHDGKHREIYDRILDVRGYIDPDDHPDGVDPKILDAIADCIHNGLSRYEMVLVHCWEGIERSALAIAWYLCKYGHAKNLPDAYDMIQDKRPQVMRRIEWIMWRLVDEGGWLFRASKRD